VTLRLNSREPGPGAWLEVQKELPPQLPFFCARVTLQSYKWCRCESTMGHARRGSVFFNKCASNGTTFLAIGRGRLSGVRCAAVHAVALFLIVLGEWLSITLRLSWSGLHTKGEKEPCAQRDRSADRRSQDAQGCTAFAPACNGFNADRCPKADGGSRAAAS
jgi:hypothetical protein